MCLAFFIFTQTFKKQLWAEEIKKQRREKFSKVPSANQGRQDQPQPRKPPLKKLKRNKEKTGGTTDKE
jgi:hypothetical protein